MNAQEYAEPIALLFGDGDDTRSANVYRLEREVRELQRALDQRDAELAELRSERQPSVADVLSLLHAVIDAGIDTLYGPDIAKPWATAEPRPPRMTAEQLTAMRRISIADARASKRVGRGRGCVADPETKEQLREDAEELASEPPPRSEVDE